MGRASKHMCTFLASVVGTFMVGLFDAAKFTKSLKDADVYLAQPGVGWCTDSKGREGTARRMEAMSCSDALARCTHDQSCVAYACVSNMNVSVLYTATNCTVGCHNTQWLENPSMISRGSFDTDGGYNSEWQQGTCFVRQSQVTTTLPAATDCVQSSWTSWTSCSLTCGGGTQTKSRSTSTQPQNGGTACGALSASQACNADACPVDCVQSSWSSWSSCSLTCGGGTQTKSRSTSTQPQNGGTVCGALSSSQACNTDACPVDCVQSSWTSWSSCSLTCGSGTQTKSRSTSTLSQNGGTPCGALSASQVCNTDACPVDCVQSSWSPWTSCSLTCGGGTQTKSRSTSTQSQNGGTVCGALSASQACNTDACPVNCVEGSWSGWGSCSLTCGTGSQTRTRSQTQPHNGGVACGASSEMQSCNTFNCPVNCVEGSWGGWGSCAVTCGTGSQTRTRSLTQPQEGGAACGTSSQSQACNTFSCPVNCVEATWTVWGSCSLSCGTGSQTKTRSLTQPQHGGVACGASSQSQTCNTFSCPVNCVEGSWGSWSTCTVTCGGGSQTRTRSLTQPQNGGSSCGASSESQTCNTGACTVSGTWQVPTGTTCTDDSHWSSSYVCQNTVSSSTDDYYITGDGNHGVNSEGTVNLTYDFQTSVSVAGMRQYQPFAGANLAVNAFTVYKSSSSSGPWTSVFSGTHTSDSSFVDGTTSEWTPASDRYWKLTVSSNHIDGGVGYDAIVKIRNIQWYIGDSSSS